MTFPEKVEKGIRNPGYALNFGKKRALQAVEPSVVYGKNIFDYEWDVCIILDACRYDLFEEVVAENPEFEEYKSSTKAWSLASATPQWAPRTFRRAPTAELNRTAYVTAQGQINKDGSEELGTIDNVWEYTSTPTPPEYVTERAINYIRGDDFHRVVIHHELPHAPFPHCYGKYDSEYGGRHGTQAVWEGLRSGRFSYDEVWADYKIALERGLKETERIVDDIRGDILVTSDHGNLLGEHGFYGHPKSLPVPTVRYVPWVVVEGRGSGELEGISRQEASDGEGTDLESHLEALGYR